MGRKRNCIASALYVALVVTIGLAVTLLHAQDGAKAEKTLPWGSQYYMVDPFWPKPLPNDWLTGSMGGISVDKNDNVITVQRTADDNNFNDHEKQLARPSPPFIVFDPAGNVIKTWGDYKVVPNGIHDCYVDYEGN